VHENHTGICRAPPPNHGAPNPEVLPAPRPGMGGWGYASPVIAAAPPRAPAILLYWLVLWALGSGERRRRGAAEARAAAEIRYPTETANATSQRHLPCRGAARLASGNHLQPPTSY
jgi:hypothetical protein